MVHARQSILSFVIEDFFDEFVFNDGFPIGKFSRLLWELGLLMFSSWLFGVYVPYAKVNLLNSPHGARNP